ncbi:cell wall-active antibiotics response protein LiaF [Paenibacillus sp. N1-5-1-14]|uniref:cell wall-active antibiotics response protein LiaF n=1 Tax=Paenibacillus radicibacter TaxID=2972488 RepID=UPI002158D6D1|nr:cell wall-active antibiotics response protein LiaF [Paenibacillus radicibacter]MCR8645344.1 cell wall-active antibiotics response protein LiaF [Paenibacillus radicibacter]
MEEQKKNYRNRNTALFLIGTGVFLIFSRLIGTFPMIAILIFLLGFYQLRTMGNRKGLTWIVIGLLFLLVEHMALVIFITLASLVYFYYQSKKVQKKNFHLHKQNILGGLRLGGDPYVLRDSSVWFMFGEVHIDLSMALIEQKETTILLQGMIGDIDIRVPEELGLSVEAFSFMGPIDVEEERENGLMNRIHYRSANYDTSANQVKVLISYIVGDIDVKILD